MRAFFYTYISLTLLACTSTNKPRKLSLSPLTTKNIEVKAEKNWQKWVDGYTKERSSKDGWLSLAVITLVK